MGYGDGWSGGTTRCVERAVNIERLDGGEAFAVDAYDLVKVVFAQQVFYEPARDGGVRMGLP